VLDPKKIPPMIAWRPNPEDREKLAEIIRRKKFRDYGKLFREAIDQLLKQVKQ
jgi:hypothetical protein